jgi:hypothetical protein
LHSTLHLQRLGRIYLNIALNARGRKETAQFNSMPSRGYFMVAVSPSLSVSVGVPVTVTALYWLRSLWVTKSLPPMVYFFDTIQGRKTAP